MGLDGGSCEEVEESNGVALELRAGAGVADANSRRFLADGCGEADGEWSFRLRGDTCVRATSACVGLDGGGCAGEPNGVAALAGAGDGCGWACDGGGLVGVVGAEGTKKRLPVLGRM